MKKIYYINHFGDKSNYRENSLAGDNKMAYIIYALKKCGYELEVISFCEVKDKTKILKKYKEYETRYYGIKVKYFTWYASKYKLIRIIGKIITWIHQKKYIKNNCLKNDCEIIIYHSLSLLKLYKYLYRKKKKFILEVEEIYSDVFENRKKRKNEINYLQKAAKYVVVSELLNKEINKLDKPYIISHGTYKVEEQQKKIKFDNNMIHCVYAGTFDPQKGGAAIAAHVSEYLPENYHVHILGYTSPELAKKMKDEVLEIQKKSKAIVTYDGVLAGNDYIKFLQSCDIGLSTQNPEKSFNMTSFPSKILSYMANGLRVVSVKIPVVESSKVGKYIYYYDKQLPRDIANAIIKVNINDNYDSKIIINKLDKDFRKELINLIEKSD